MKLLTKIKKFVKNNYIMITLNNYREEKLI